MQAAGRGRGAHIEYDYWLRYYDNITESRRIAMSEYAI
jgi:hypothetical protein